jgi:DNA-binding beta-propeller fold protein YncE
MEVGIMSQDKINFGIIAEHSAQRISIFNADTLQIIKQIPMNADVIDVALSRKGYFAVASSFVSKTMFKINLCNLRKAHVAYSATTATLLEDVALTPDNRFAISVDGAADSQDIVSYSVRENIFVSTLPTVSQAVAVSPKGNGVVLTAKYDENTVGLFKINNKGVLTDTGQELPAGDSPININFTPDGNFAFVANTEDAVSVLSTANPDNISLLEIVAASDNPQSMAVSKSGRYVFLLGRVNVDIFTFDPVSGSLALARSFAHGLGITSYYGVDQIALDPYEERLFISANGEVAVFTTYGVKLGTVTGIAGPGGLAIGTHVYS